MCCLSPEGGNQRVKFVTSTTVDATTGRWIEGRTIVIVIIVVVVHCDC